MCIFILPNFLHLYGMTISPSQSQLKQGYRTNYKKIKNWNSHAVTALLALLLRRHILFGSFYNSVGIFRGAIRVVLIISLCCLECSIFLLYLKDQIWSDTQKKWKIKLWVVFLWLFIDRLYFICDYFWFTTTQEEEVDPQYEPVIRLTEQVETKTMEEEEEAIFKQLVYHLYEFDQNWFNKDERSFFGLMLVDLNGRNAALEMFVCFSTRRPRKLGLWWEEIRLLKSAQTTWVRDLIMLRVKLLIGLVEFLSWQSLLIWSYNQT